MVAIGTGTGVGLERSSASLIGSRGQIGSASTGRGGDNVFVNAANGNLVITRQDEFLVGLGPDVAISRTYNSQATTIGDGDNNDQWRMSPYRKIVGTNGAASVTRVDWDGSETVYLQTAANSYATSDGAGGHDSIAWNGTQWVWTDGNSRLRETYDSSGKLLSSKDTDGNTLEYFYAGALLTSITDQNGERTDFVYGGTGGAQLQRITTVAGSSSVRVHYTYDSSNRLHTVAVDLSPGDGSISDGYKYVTTYGYDGASNRVASISQTDGSLLEIGYAYSGTDYRVVSLTETVTANVTRVTGFYYDVPNRVTRITNPAGGVTTMSYDPKGNLTQLVMPVPAPGAAAPTIAYSYLANGDLQSMTEDGRRTDYEYDAAGNLKLTRDAAGNTTRRTYDSRNQLLTSTLYLVRDEDGAGTGAATVPVTTRYAYDAAMESHLRFAISAEGDVIEYQYNAAGQLVSTIAYTAQKYEIGLLAADFAPAVGTMETWAAGIADKSTVRRTDTTYDGRGDVRTVTRYSSATAAGVGVAVDHSVDTYFYSPSGQLLKRLNNQSTAEQLFYYDGLGRLTATTDMANASTGFAFTENSTTTTTITTSASGLTRLAVYNKAGELVSVVETGANVAPATTNYSYDSLGRLRMEAKPTGTIYHVYDHASRKVADITSDGSMTEYSYDASGRLVKTVGYIDKLTPTQIGELDEFSAGGLGGAATGAQGIVGSPTGLNLVFNGGFDSSGPGFTILPNVGRSNPTLPGWIKINSEAYEQVSSGVGGVTATVGDYWLDMDSVAGSGTLIATGDNFVLNPSFENSATSYTSYTWGRSSTTLPDWTKFNPEQFEQVLSGNYGIAASNGQNWLELDSLPSVRVTTGGNLLLNGSFDTPDVGATNTGYGFSSSTLPNWIKANPEKFEQIQSGHQGVTASNGGYWLDLDSVPGTGTHLATGPSLLTNGSFDASAPTYTTHAWGRSSSTLPGWLKNNTHDFEQFTSGGYQVTGTDGAYWLDLDSVWSIDTPTGNNLLVNGSFDTSAPTYTTTSTGRVNTTLPGWTNSSPYSFEQVAAGQHGVTGTSGAYWLDLDSVPNTSGNPNLIVNGSFEQSAATYTTTGTGRLNSGPIPGWTGGLFEQTNSGTGGVAATEGSFFLDGDAGTANMDISQTVANLAAGAHTLKFDFANIAGFVGDEGDSSGSLAVYWNGTLIGTVGSTETALTTKTFTVNAVAGNNTVRFKETGVRNGLGVYIDNVRLTSNLPSAGGNMNISQTVNLTAGEKVQLKFNYANRAAAGSGNFRVLWNDQVIMGGTIPSNLAMTTYTHNLTAIAGNNVLRFESLGTVDGAGASLDNVSLHRVTTSPNGGNMDIYQTVPNLTAGQVMKLQFNHANTTVASSGSFDVLWNDDVVAQYNNTGYAMVAESLNLTAIAGTNKLRFRATGTVDGRGAAIDNVRLFATVWDPNGGNMDIRQTVGGLTAGQMMRIQFDHANRTTAASGSFDVWWNTVRIAQITSTGTTMLPASYDVEAIAGDNTLRFVGTGTADATGASIDNVRLFATQLTPNGGNMDVRQAINGLTAGQTYKLQFDHANTTTAASGSFNVYWNSDLVAQINSTGTTMLAKSYFVQAAAGANTLRFLGTGSTDASGAAIDNVRLHATVLEPDGGNMDFSQTILNLTAGDSMLLQFDHANRASPGSGTFEVYWNGDRVAEITSTGTTMVTKSLNVIALGGSNVLRFRGTGTVDAVGASIDNVRLFTTQAATAGGGGTVADPLAGLRPTLPHDDNRYWWNIYDAAGRLVETIDGSGAVTSLTYDGASRLVETRAYATRIDVSSYKTSTPTGLVLPGADSNDRVARNFYRRDGLLVGTLDGEGYLTENVYDGNGLLIETIGYATATAGGDRAAGSFETLKGGVVAPVNGKDVHNWYVYDGRGLLRGEINGEGDLTRYHYTAAGDMDQKVRGQKLDPAALMVSRPTFASLPTSAGGQITETTTYARDNAGKVTSEVRHLASGSWTTSFGYDAAGRLTSRTEAAGGADARTVTQRFDARGNLIGELGGRGSAALAALGGNPDPATVDTVYATWGTVYTYDAGDRLVAVRRANGVNAAGNRTVYYYRDKLLAFEVNAPGEVVEYRYNARGERTDTIAYGTRIAPGTLPGLTGGEVTTGFQAIISGIADSAKDSLSHVDYNVTGTVKQSIDPLSNSVTYGYNAFGELKTRTDPIDASTSVQTERLYDRRGLLRSEKRDSAGSLQLETLYGHDAFGRPNQVTDPGGRVRKTAYDRAGRVSVTTDGRNLTQSFGYDGRGNVLTLTDRNQTTTTFAYDPFNEKMTTTTPGQITTRMTRNAHGETVSVKDGALRETTYAYDKDGNLETETDSVSQVKHIYDMAGRRQETIDARGSRISYTYDAANRILSEEVDDGGLSLLTKYEYDAQGRNFKITDPALQVTRIEFDKAGRKAAVIVDDAGFAFRTQYDYDKSGRLLTVTEAHGTTAARVTKYEYDKADRLLSSRVDPAGLNLLTQYSYDRSGNVARKTDAANHVTTYAYDEENRLTRTLDPEGGVVETYYDNEGRVAGLRRYAAAGSASPAANNAFTISVASGGSDQLSAYYYDLDGRLKVSVDGGGRPTEYVYDDAGNVLRSIDHAGPIAYTVGDTLATIQGRIAALGNPGARRTTRAVYDGANRQAYSIDATGQVTAFGRDAAGNVVKQVRYANLYTATDDPSFAAMGLWAAGNANGDDRVDRTFFDGASRATFTVDAENYVTQNKYDAAGRITAQIRHAYKYYSTGDGVTEAGLSAQVGLPLDDAAITRFTYDSAGRLTDTTDPENSVTHLVLDELGQATLIVTASNVPADSSATERVFDKAGRMTKETRAFGAPEASVTEYEHDGMGRVLKAKRPYNVTVQYVYDGMGRCIQEIQPLNASQTANTYRQYDRFGNLVKLTDPRNNSAIFHYDALNRLEWQTDPEGYVTRTSYSRGDEVASVTRYAVPVSGTTVETPPAVSTNPALDATTSFERDKLDRVTSTTDAEFKTETYTLNAFGDRIVVKNRINGETHNLFDKRGLLTQETLPVGSTKADGTSAAANVVNKYDYDSRGNRTKTTEAHGIAGEERMTRFEYDRADRLARKIGQLVSVLTSPTGAETSTTPTETYKYDARGNLVETLTSWGARTLSYYDDHDRKVAEIQATSSTQGTLSKWDYDLNGNVKAGRIYSDPFALPFGVGGAAPNSTSAYRETLYDYDSNNRRIRSKVLGLQSGEYGSTYLVGDIILETVYDMAGNVVQEKDGRDKSTYFYYDRAGRKIAQVDQELYLTFYTLDGDGNVKTEERFAERVAAANVGSIAGDLRSSVAGGLGNRVTNFEYDRNGRRTAETRMGVNGKKLSAIGQLEAAHSPDARIEYEYNGLGQVVRKREANLDFTLFQYDLLGRQTSVQSASYFDFQNNEVSRRTETFYNGLGAVTRSIAKSRLGNDDRLTTYSYTAGGRLDHMTDAAGFVRTYSYDAAGNLVREAYSRADSAGIGSDEASAFRYDLLNRITSQSMLTKPAGSWAEGVVTKVRYNSFGEMTGRGLNADSGGTTYQETFDYDAGGRMWRSTSGDGTVRLYGHDKAGNANLVIASAGADLSNLSLAAAIGAYGSGGAAVATTATEFDGRGQATKTHELQREIANGVVAPPITTTRVYNAFGEVRQEIDAFNRATDYSYNSAGKLTKRELPTAAYTPENGVAVSGTRASETYSYDLSGRRIGVENAYGHKTTQQLLAGTGYGDDEGVVLAEFHADDGVARRKVDEFGDIRSSIDEVLRVTGYTYDKMGRLTELAHEGGLIDSYRYDGLGQRTQHWNSHYGSGFADRTDYDSQGRVRRFVQASQAETAVSTAYVWDAGAVTNGLGTLGGWVKTTIHEGRTVDNDATETIDYFGRMIGKSDFGGRNYTFTYDNAGRLTQQTNTANQNLTFTYFNTGKTKRVVDGYTNSAYSPSSIEANFAYDIAGRRVFESYAKTSYVYNYYTGYAGSYTESLQSATVTYDDLGRMKKFEDTGASGSNPAVVEWEYDRVGNIRKIRSTYQPIVKDYMTGETLAPITTERWFTYDSMNRMVWVNGKMTDGQIGSDHTIGSGIAVHDQAGQRKYFITQFMEYGPTGVAYGQTREEYKYTPSGYLQEVSQATANWNFSTGQLGAFGPSKVIANDTRDALGRLTLHEELSWGGMMIAHSRSSVYNVLSQVTYEETGTLQNNWGWQSSTVNYHYRTESFPLSGSWTGDYLGGAVTHIGTSTSDGYSTQISDVRNSYVWWDDAQVAVASNRVSPTETHNSTYTYDENGKLASVNIQDGRPRTVNYVTDLNGQVMSRTEYSQVTTNPINLYYYFNGVRMGEVSNNGPGQTDYSTAIAQRSAPPQTGPFKTAYGVPASAADFEQAFTPISPGSEPNTASNYTVREGDTLRTVAHVVWGDPDMWYLIGEANGLGATSALVAGQKLRIPAKVTNIHNNAQTFRVYDPNKAIGNTSPSEAAQPKPAQRRGGCGMLGMIILIAIAVAVTIILKVPVTNLIAFGSTVAPVTAAGTVAIASTGAAIAGAVVTGAIASVVSQGVGVATGLQEKFSWKGVAMSALSAGITQGVGGGTLLAGAGKFANDVARGALISTATQGVAVATGLQKKFDWAGIAVAGVVGGVTGAIGRALPGQAGSTTPVGYTNNFVSKLGGALAGAAVRSVVTGTNFGDNVVAVLPDVIGSTIGNLVGETINQQMARRQTAAASEKKTGSSTNGDGDGDIVVTGSGPRQPNILTDPISLNGPAYFEFEGVRGSIDFAELSQRLTTQRSLAAPTPGPEGPSIGEDWSGNRVFTIGNDPYYQTLMAIGGSTSNLEAYETYSRSYTPEGLAGAIDEELRSLVFQPGQSSWERPAYSMAAFLGSEGQRLAGVGDRYPALVALGQQLMGLARDYRTQADEAYSWRMQQAGPAAAPVDTRNGWNRGLSSAANWGDGWIDWIVGGYSGMRQRQERMGPSPNGYVGDVAVGFVSTIARAGTGLVRAFADPATAARGLANGIDNILLDDRRAVDVARSNWDRLRSSSAHEIALGTGEVGGHVFLIVGPAKVAAGRMAFTARPSAFATLEPLVAAENASLRIASGLGESSPASIVRIIQRGESVANIINEGKALTFTTGNEHALVKLAGGERALVAGGPGGIEFAEGSVTRIFGHSHPTSAPPSAADFRATLQLGQSKQYVFHGGQVTVVRPKR
jgi:YD repeat-containing protein